MHLLCKLLIHLFISSLYGIMYKVPVYKERQKIQMPHIPYVFEGRSSVIVSEVASIKDFPFMVSLFFDHEPVCAGTILNEWWVITAAHCIFSSLKMNLILMLFGGQRCFSFLNFSVSVFLAPNAIATNNHSKESITLQAGSSKSYDRKAASHSVEKTIIHNKFIVKLLAHDIALIKIKNPFKYSVNVMPIHLPGPKFILNFHEYAKVLGWGMTREFDNSSYTNILRVAKVSILNTTVCKNVYKKFITSHRIICAGFQEAGVVCTGDSGGPLVINNTIIGIISFGKYCWKSGYPSVYTKVVSYRNWIKKHSGI